jgi:hypothetical protein
VDENHKGGLLNAKSVSYVDNTDYDDDRWYDERRCEGKTSWEMA